MLTDLLRLFAQNPLHPAYAAPEHRLDRVPEPLDWVAFDGGIVRVGHEGDGFAFDCEAPAQAALLAPYPLAARPVTHAQCDQQTVVLGKGCAVLVFSLGRRPINTTK